MTLFQELPKLVVLMQNIDYGYAQGQVKGMFDQNDGTCLQAHGHRRGSLSRRGRGQPKPTIRDNFETRNDT